MWECVACRSVRETTPPCDTQMFARWVRPRLPVRRHGRSPSGGGTHLERRALIGVGPTGSSRRARTIRPRCRGQDPNRRMRSRRAKGLEHLWQLLARNHAGVVDLDGRERSSPRTRTRTGLSRAVLQGFSHEFDSSARDDRCPSGPAGLQRHRAARVGHARSDFPDDIRAHVVQIDERASQESSTDRPRVKSAGHRSSGHRSALDSTRCTSATSGGSRLARFMSRGRLSESPQRFLRSWRDPDEPSRNRAVHATAVRDRRATWSVRAPDSTAGHVSCVPEIALLVLRVLELNGHLHPTGFSNSASTALLVQANFHPAIGDSLQRRRLRAHPITRKLAQAQGWTYGLSASANRGPGRTAGSDAIVEGWRKRPYRIDFEPSPTMPTSGRSVDIAARPTAPRLLRHVGPDEDLARPSTYDDRLRCAWHPGGAGVGAGVAVPRHHPLPAKRERTRP